MSRVTVGPSEVRNKPNGVKFIQALVRTEFETECNCKQVTVKVYRHAEGSVARITGPQGTSNHGTSDDPQGVPWRWTPGPDGWITDSQDTDPRFNPKNVTCEPGVNGNVVTVADRPGIGIPAADQGVGFTYAFQFMWKVDLLCDGKVVDKEFYKLVLAGKGGPNGPVPYPAAGSLGRDTVNELNRRMRATGTYSVDSEGKPL